MIFHVQIGVFLILVSFLPHLNSTFLLPFSPALCFVSNLTSFPIFLVYSRTHAIFSNIGSITVESLYSIPFFMVQRFSREYRPPSHHVFMLSAEILFENFNFIFPIPTSPACGTFPLFLSKTSDCEAFYGRNKYRE